MGLKSLALEDLHEDVGVVAVSLELYFLEAAEPDQDFPVSVWFEF